MTRIPTELELVDLLAKLCREDGRFEQIVFDNAYCYLGQNNRCPYKVRRTVTVHEGLHLYPCGRSYGSRGELNDLDD